MSKPHAILLVPTEEFRSQLLGEGPCGARPPTAFRRTYARVVHVGNRFADPTISWEVCCACDEPWPCPTPGKVESEGFIRWKPGNRHTTVADADALVLKWGGEPVAEGMDRAARMHPEYTGAAWASSRSLGREMERLGYGRTVEIDAEGREVSGE